MTEINKNEILACVPEKWKKGKMSDHAAAAVIIRTLLKKEGIAARVRSEIGGYTDSVSIETTDADPFQTDKIAKISSFFKAGHFDGMRDIYEDKPEAERLAGVPSVYYVFHSNENSDELRNRAFEFVKNRFAEGTDEADLKHFTKRILNADEGECRGDGMARDFWNAVLKEKYSQKETSKAVDSAESVTAKDAEFIETDKFFQVKFSAKPAAEVLENLKNNGFKWFRCFGYWGTFKNGRTAEEVKQALNFA